MSAAAFVSTCSCGFRSEPLSTSTDALDAYRRHEKDHAPGQRRGEVEAVQVTRAASPAKAPAATAAPRKGRGPIY